MVGFQIERKYRDFLMNTTTDLQTTRALRVILTSLANDRDGKAAVITDLVPSQLAYSCISCNYHAMTCIS